MPLSRRVVAEFIGTAFLLIAVVGGGIAAQRLSPNDTGLQLFEAAVVTAFGLAAFIMMLGPISGAHFNPAVTLADVALGNRPSREAVPYISAQVLGGVAGTILSNLMFELPAIQISETARSGSGQWLGEVIATIGLLLVIFLMLRKGQYRSHRHFGRHLHRRRLLLHFFNQLRQSGGHDRPDVQRYLRRNRAVIRAGLCDRATGCSPAGGGLGPVPDVRMKVETPC